jgi:protein-L-isoaspartate(D-aspartate) O-methyltransferase
MPSLLTWFVEMSIWQKYSGPWDTAPSIRLWLTLVYPIKKLILDLATRAAENLSSYANVTVHAGDGAVFDPGECDAMLINAGMTHPIPLWLDHLRDRGRLVLPLTMAIGPMAGMGFMAKIVRERGGFSARIVTSVAIYSCKNARDPEREASLKAVMTSGGLMKMRSVRRDAHEPTDTCVMHGGDVCLSSVEVG